MKIAVIGTHGIGKTTLISKFFTYAVGVGKNVRLVHEVVRDCPFGINDQFSLDSASWIITKQIVRELETKARCPEVILCDRSALDPAMYVFARFGHNHDDHIYALTMLAYEWLSTYDSLIFLRPSSVAILPDGVRDTNVEFQQKVDQEFALSISNYREEYPEKKIYTLSSSSVHNKDLIGLFSTILEDSYD